MKSIVLAICLLLCFSIPSIAQGPVISIIPDRPEVGKEVLITVSGSTFIKAPELVFSYSNLFELPSSIPLTMVNGKWETRFVVPRYAKYASFYIKSGDTILRPNATQHYELIFHAGGKPVFDTYLYKSYSLASQMGKNADSLRLKTNLLIEKEIEIFPQNYAAKLKLLSNKMQDDPTQATQYLKEGLALVEQKFKSSPTQMANINQVTMGFLILGLPKRLDSIKAVILKDYPDSEVAQEYRYEQASALKDEADRLQALKMLLNYKGSGENSTEAGIHKQLFEYYASKKDTKMALLYARKAASVSNPWTPKLLEEIAGTLASNNIALDSALGYATLALSQVNNYPLGVIRYFPEYGYIPGYVANREQLIQEQRAAILSLIGNIETRQNRFESAELRLKEAAKISANLRVYENLAFLYEKTNRHALALESLKKLYLLNPTDSAALKSLKRNYSKVHGSLERYDEELSALEKEWQRLNLPILRKTKINQLAPTLLDIFDLNGKQVNLDGLRGKVLVIDFWATWCVPCIAGFPYMEQVYKQFAGNQDVIFLILNSGSKNTLEDASTWVSKNKFKLPFFYNDRKLAGAFNVNTIPSTFVIDRNGNIRYKTVGFEGPMMLPKLSLMVKDVLDSK